MSEDKFKDNENKVLPIENWLKARQEGEDGISQLLEHMRRVREAIPVNRRLQAELRKKLLERQRELMNQNQLTPTVVNNISTKLKNKCHPWLIPALGTVAVIMLVFALTRVWMHTSGQLHLEASGSPQEITRFWTETQPLQPTVSPDGSKIIVVRGGGLVLLSETGVQQAYLEPPEDGYFRSPSWSPDGKKVSLVVSNNGSEEIKVFTTDELLSSAKSKYFSDQRVAVSLNEESPQNVEAQEAPVADNAKVAVMNAQESAAPHYSDLVYSPDGKKLAYVISVVGEPSAIWVQFADGETRRITEGDAPTWSPDGKHLVVQRPSRTKGCELWLVNIETGGADLLGQGGKPVWSKNGYLAFCTVKEQERILTFLPNGEPQYSVRQQVAEVRVSYLGEDGSATLRRLSEGEGWLADSYLLVPPENHISGMEINWLRQQELSGSHEPKTLVLNEINKCEGQVFSSDGKWLLFARRDGDTVALVKLQLEERWEKERE